MKYLIGVRFLKSYYNKYRANDFFYKKKSKKNICIKLPIPNWNEAGSWGDYYFAISLKKALEKFEYGVKIQILKEWYLDDKNDDIIIVLRGLLRYRPNSNKINLMWNISHPLEVSDSEYEDFDHVFVASMPYTKILQSKLNTSVSLLFQCADTTLFFPTNHRKNDQIIFIGNSHGTIRPMVKIFLNQQISIDIYGVHWEGLIDSKYIKSKFIPNNKLRYYYSSSSIVLNDHWDDMKNYGFVSNRIFDVLACNGTLLSDEIQAVPSDIKTFFETISYDETNIEQVISRVKNKKPINSYEIISKNHSFDNRAKTIHDFIKKLTN